MSEPWLQFISQYANEDKTKSASERQKTGEIGYNGQIKENT